MKKLIPGHRLAATNLNLLEVVLVFGILVLLVAGFTPVWTQTTAPTNHVYDWIASSADGKIVCAINSYIPALLTSNGGDTWTTNGTPTAAYGIAISADGTKLILSAISNNTNYIFVSTNTGNTWQQTILPSGFWQAVATSADGAKLFAANTVGFIYASTNFGVTWHTNSAYNKDWTSIACSADGNRVVAIAYGDKIYASTDSGMTWTPTSAPGKYLNSICSSRDGRVLAATGGDGTSISTNFGSTWITTNIFGQSIACSVDGKRLEISGSSTQVAYGTIWISADSGMTWATNNALKYCSGIASSADGCKLWATDVLSPGIWVGQTTPSPELKIEPTGGNFAFSWLVPSTNFVLQQSPDLTPANWVTLTNAPTLNFTDLNYELVLSRSNSSGFFRLATP